jgi:RNA exonuclease 4
MVLIKQTKRRTLKHLSKTRKRTQHGLGNSISNLPRDTLVESPKDIENSVALDCEMVGVGPRGSKSALAQVAICDFWGNTLYNEYVIPPEGIKGITQYRTEYSGITKDILQSKGKPFRQVVEEVKRIISGRNVIGHGLDNDFTVLHFRPDEKYIWDSTKIEEYLKPHPLKPHIKQPRKLKNLAKSIANNNIQMADRIGHSPLEDARASMNLYRISLGYPKVMYDSIRS